MDGGLAPCQTGPDSKGEISCHAYPLCVMLYLTCTCVRHCYHNWYIWWDPLRAVFECKWRTLVLEVTGIILDS